MNVYPIFSLCVLPSEHNLPLGYVVGYFPMYAYSYILPVFVILSAILLPHLATPYDVDIFVEN